MHSGYVLVSLAPLVEGISTNSSVAWKFGVCAAHETRVRSCVAQRTLRVGVDRTWCSIASQSTSSQLRLRYL